MAAGTTDSTKTCDRINTLVTALPGIVECFQGKHRFPETENLENETRGLTPESQGYFFFWVNDANVGNFTKTGELLVTGYLQVYIPTDSTSDTNAALDLAGSIVAACGNEDNFSDLGVRPMSPQFSEDPLDDQEDGIVKYLFALKYQLPIVCNA